MTKQSRLRVGLIALLATVTLGITLATTTAQNPVQTVQAAKSYSKAANQYVTVKKSGYAFWKTFGFKTKLHDSKNYLNHALQVKRIYGRSDGSKYYSVYRGGKWYGYLNAKAAVSSKAYGVAVKPGKTLYVYANNKDKQGFHKDAGWADLNFKKKLYINLTLMPFTYTVKYEYFHSNGSTYYSLYRNKTWMGYINASQVKKTDFLGSGVGSLRRPFYITAGDEGAKDKDDYIYNRSMKIVGKLAKGSKYRAKNAYNAADGGMFVSVYSSNGKSFKGYARHSW